MTYPTTATIEPRAASNSGSESGPKMQSLELAKRAFITRNVDLDQVAGLLVGDHRPAPGDLVLAEVVRLGQHQRLELTTGRRARMSPGDRVLVCFGDRYAPDQFESRVPENMKPCHLVAAGGIASEMVSRHRRMKRPTMLQPLALAVDADGNRINLRNFRLPRRTLNSGQFRPQIIAVAGTAMNAGKTTTAAHLIRGLNRAGFKVSSAKVTGTGAGGDYWFMLDSGARPVLDFTDAGYASTFDVSRDALEDIFETLVGELIQHRPDVIVLEIADGIFQEETAIALGMERFRQLVDHVIFTAADATGALAGKLWLQQHRLPLRAISGVLTASPLAMREAARATSLPVFDMEQLASPDCVQDLIFGDAQPLQVVSA